MEEKFQDEMGENLVVGTVWALVISLPVWAGIIFLVYRFVLSF
ncbi:hypothetical protein JOC54_002280 [Alkalihalobacillus xiaoxiensis]|uniref:Uncharacterized protein n=1 Tax=Shouchella xiaoxiensis TaxID=766895 RepID=A0ABS2SW32_9BACI|nr:hypothetical protein [Shouchella xiaoxiensis]MBM7839010.1 hypothetical protein [Shouchella xiaoxiensis]